MPTGKSKMTREELAAKIKQRLALPEEVKPAEVAPDKAKIQMLKKNKQQEVAKPKDEAVEALQELIEEQQLAVLFQEAYDMGYTYGFDQEPQPSPYGNELDEAYEQGYMDGEERTTLLEVVFSALAVVESTTEEELNEAYAKLTSALGSIRNMPELYSEKYDRGADDGA